MKAIIFDCFGVLIGKGFENTYRRAGGDPIADRKFIESVLLSANLGEITDDEFHMQLSKHLNMQLDKWISTTVKAEDVYKRQEIFYWIFSSCYTSDIAHSTSFPEQ